MSAGILLSLAFHSDLLIKNHREHRETSRLLKYVPEIVTFFTPLPLSEAFAIYDDKYCTSKRTQIGIVFTAITLATTHNRRRTHIQ